MLREPGRAIGIASVLLLGAIAGGVLWQQWSHPSGKSEARLTEAVTAGRRDSAEASSPAEPLLPTNPQENGKRELLRGLLIDGTDRAVSGGDVLYKFIARANETCDSRDLDFELDPNTEIVRSDEHGRFDIPLPDDPEAQEKQCLLLHASREGYTGSIVALDMDLHSGTVELELEQHLSLRGQVVTPDGGRISGASIRSWKAENPQPNQETDLCAKEDKDSLVERRSGDDGQFALDLAGDNLFCIQASHPRWASSEPQLQGSAQARREHLTLTLNDPLQASGRVLDSNGHPVVDLSLQLAGKNQTVTATTNGAGDFTFPGLDVGDYQLSSLDRSYAIDRPQTISVQAGQSIEGVEVIAFPVTAVRGRVVGSRGNPLEDVRVTTRSPYLPDASISSALSDASGYFEVRSEHRSKAVADVMKMTAAMSERGEETGASVDFAPLVCVSFYHPRYRGDDLAVTTDDLQLDLGTIYLEAPQLVFDGLVTNHRGEGIAATLTFRPAKKGPIGEPSSRCENSAAPIRVSANEQGEFSLHVENTGVYEVEAETERYSTRRLEVTLSQPGEQVIINID